MEKIGFETKRVFGLDVLRAAAVSFVVSSHMLQNSAPPHWVAQFGRLGILGVEIFFVLSGYLIGGILLDLCRRERLDSPDDVLQFWRRRWLRTLPLYYLFLAIYLWFDWKGPTRLRDHLEYLVFLQNFAWRSSDYFLVSWSLAIEEHFYLLFPLALMLLRRGVDRERALLATVLLFLTAPLAVKFAVAPFPDWSDFDYRLRMEVVTRLDSMMYGVAAVFVERTHPALWAAVKKRSSWAAVAAVAVSAYLYLDMPGLIGSRWLESLLFPLISLTAAALLPAFAAWRAPVVSGLARSVTYVSTISYSIYLGHVLVLCQTNAVLQSTPGAWEGVWTHPLRLYPLYLSLILAFASLTYYGWERPFLWWRDRHTTGR